MALTFTMLICFMIVGLGLTVGLLSLMEVLFSTPVARSRQIDTRVRASEALGQEPEALQAPLVSQSA